MVQDFTPGFPGNFTSRLLKFPASEREVLEIGVICNELAALSTTNFPYSEFQSMCVFLLLDIKLSQF